MMENKTKRILFLMTIPWGWIKQRPHFIAEKLSRNNKVDVFYKIPLKVSKKDLLTQVPSDNNNLQVFDYFILPFERLPILKYFRFSIVNKLFLHLYIKNINQYDVVWFTSPTLYSLLANRIGKSKIVVYDCMDDMAEFGLSAVNIKVKKTVLSAEKRLLERANVVFCSAAYLKNKILTRAGLEEKEAVVVNNAIEIPGDNGSNILPDEVLALLLKIESYNNNIMYIGTISEWFDFKTILYALEKDNSLNVTLIGPSQVEIPKHNRIIYLGTIGREYLFHFMKYAKALIMPFVVNELIRSVNPVKLYEYIYSGRPVIASRYGETEKFSDFAYLYSNQEEFCRILDEIDKTIVDDNYLEKCRNFVKNNTWEQRCSMMESVLAGIHN